MKKRITILCSICVILLALAVILDRKYNKDLEKNNYLKELSYEEVIEKIENKESFILCLSQTTCSNCNNFKPKLKQVADEYKVLVYYTETDLYTEEQTKSLLQYFSFDGTPTTIFIKEGEEKTAANRINGDVSTSKIIKKLKSNGYIE